MKMLFSLIITTVFLFSQTINEQIHALEDASPEQRVELMNSIKKQLISMNQEKRMKTIGDLQKKLQVKHEQRNTETTHQLENTSNNEDEPTADAHLEQHEMQEHMMNRSHSADSERQQSSGNHGSRGQAGDHDNTDSNNQSNRRR